VRVEHLLSSTPADVREDVITAIADGAPGGGFILGTTHSIAVGTRYDSFMGLLDAYLDAIS
jgi:uroporphyrinogen-III decarboxylase